MFFNLSLINGLNEYCTTGANLESIVLVFLYRADWIGLCGVLRPHQHSTGYMLTVNPLIFACFTKQISFIS